MVLQKLEKLEMHSECCLFVFAGSGLLRFFSLTRLDVNLVSIFCGRLADELYHPSFSCQQCSEFQLLPRLVLPLAPGGAPPP